MGRNPKPLHLIQGNLTKRQRMEREEKEQEMNSRLKRDKIRPPTWLDDQAKKMFRHLVKQLEETELLTNLDVNGLAHYCDLHSRMLGLRKEVEENGYTFVNKNSRGGITYVTNPALTALNSTIKLLQAYESKFGFTIYDRTKIALKDEKPKEQDSIGKRFGDI
ncbi:phage terminase small subunit P27 family [Paenibacillus profundus]|uniref:Phage terminase small subunit P27 family n=1 Tax=Paenibacillus profundus TaxID=1173085 RepID=A0ABS8Y9H7_9BACL|nr:phage terminase small subunit P27 family [Paenibacillus profundus]MCE5168515.1 phage terminase small subunit P27 family [Paenibacillus profundus]